MLPLREIHSHECASALSRTVLSWCFPLARAHGLSCWDPIFACILFMLYTFSFEWPTPVPRHQDKIFPLNSPPPTVVSLPESIPKAPRSEHIHREVRVYAIPLKHTPPYYTLFLRGQAVLLRPHAKNLVIIFNSYIQLMPRSC